MRIVKSIQFDAAHYLKTDAMADERPYARMHGHSFVLDVEIEGDQAPDTGWVVDFGDVADALDDLRSALDHRLLNEIEGLERPTLENICLWAAARLKVRFSWVKKGRRFTPVKWRALHSRALTLKLAFHAGDQILRVAAIVGCGAIGAPERLIEFIKGQVNFFVVFKGLAWRR